MVNVTSGLENHDDINNAITAIRRNGVALKGNVNTILCHMQSQVQFNSSFE